MAANKSPAPQNPSAGPVKKSTPMEPVSKFFKKRSEANAEIQKKELGKGNDVKSIFNKIAQLSRDLDFEINSLREKGAKININVEKFFSQNDRLSHDVVKDYGKAYKALNEYVNKHAPAKPAQLKPSADKLTSERKGKMRGARNRWIPVQ